MPGQTPRPPRARRGTAPPFNGGPGNCPAKPADPRPAPIAGHGPSMEGRAIARPNPPRTAGWTWRRPTFNGGPGNCPAKLRRPAVVVPGPRRPSMEGRAIARPNEFVDKIMAGDILGPSMEGRAIARPNVRKLSAAGGYVALQWRAGQLPGQTIFAGGVISRLVVAFNGGPGNCPAKPGARPHRSSQDQPPSMEGRAIARPNPVVAGLDGGQPVPSMEGRAIARPNAAGVWVV